VNRAPFQPFWGDRAGELAFNSLPAALDQKQQGIHYITSANSIAELNRTGSQARFQNGFPMQAYMLGIDNYRCCPHNYGMGWPYFVEEMWAATPDNGLVAQLHGPARVAAKVADGTAVTVTADTTYPFGDTITFSVNTPGNANDPFTPANVPTKITTNARKDLGASRPAPAHSPASTRVPGLRRS
jgi:hypothetical protein